MYSANGELLDLTLDHDVHPDVILLPHWKALLELDYHSHAME